MAFSNQTKNEAIRRSEGKCECRRQGHSWHLGKQRCKKAVTPTTAEFHHIAAQAVGGHDGLSNSEVLCGDCHRATPSFGRH